MTVISCFSLSAHPSVCFIFTLWSYHRWWNCTQADRQKQRETRRQTNRWLKLRSYTVSICLSLSLCAPFLLNLPFIFCRLSAQILDLSRSLHPSYLRVPRVTAHLVKWLQLNSIPVHLHLNVKLKSCGPWRCFIQQLCVYATDKGVIYLFIYLF